MGRIAPRFARVEPRRRAREFVLGLLSDLPRKNCWMLAEHAGNATPDGLRHLLYTRAR
ncbi:IS701 family transposase, partial [Streptomyces sp. NPDC057927]